MAVARLRPEVEIVSVDSMCVYRGMDIGTAKPSAAERDLVRHHLVDLVDPSEEFTVRHFQDAARAALADIESRRGRPLLVGGTGLYLRAVVDDLDLPGRYPAMGRLLEEEAAAPGGEARLYARLEALDPVAAARIAPSNRRRLVRALEVTQGSGRRFSSFGPGLSSYPPTRFVMVGIAFDAATDDARIERRLRAELDAGFLEEVRTLERRPAGLSRTARQALGYRELLTHLENGVALDDAVEEAVHRTKAFARRQWAWFRRDPRIVWLDREGDLVAQLLQCWDLSRDPAVGTRIALGGAGRPLQVGD